MSNVSKKQKLEAKKKFLCEVLGKKLKPLRGNKGITLFTGEYDLSGTTLSQIERGASDPKFTTLWRLTEAYGVPLWEVIKELQEELPDDFKFIDT